MNEKEILQQLRSLTPADTATIRAGDQRTVVIRSPNPLEIHSPQFVPEAKERSQFALPTHRRSTVHTNAQTQQISCLSRGTQIKTATFPTQLNPISSHFKAAGTSIVIAHLRQVHIKVGTRTSSSVTYGQSINEQTANSNVQVCSIR